MADSKLTALSAITPTDDDILYAVDDPSGTPVSKKVTVASLMRRSSLQVIAKAIDYTAVAGDLVVVDASGGNVTITLPASPVANDRIGVFAQTVGAGTNTVIVGRNSKNIDGAAANRTFYIANSYEEYQYDGTQWWVIEQKLTPHSGRMTLSSAITTNTAATSKKITFDTSVFSYGGLVDTANTRMTVRRAGRYLVVVGARPNSNVGDTKYYAAEIWLNGAVNSQNRQLGSVAAVAIVATASIVIDLAAADYVEGYFLGQEANVGVVATVSQTYFAMTEII